MHDLAPLHHQIDRAEGGDILRRVCRAVLRHLQLLPGPDGEVHDSVESWLGAELDRRVSGSLAAVAARNISIAVVVEGVAAALIVAGTRTLPGLP